MQDMLRGLRIMVVENEYLLAAELEDLVLESGGAVVGPFGRLGPALAAAGDPLDGAILDVRLDGETVFELANLLLERGVPVVLATGTGPSELPESLRAVPYIQKPFAPAALRGILVRAFRPTG